MTESWVKRSAVSAVPVTRKFDSSAERRALFAKMRAEHNGPLMDLWRRNGMAETPFNTIYFVRMGALPSYKIGKAGTLDNRLYQLQISSPAPLSVAAFITFFDGKSLSKAESLAHSIAASVGSRLRGEWFALSPQAIRMVIDRVTDEFSDEVYAVTARGDGI